MDRLIFGMLFALIAASTIAAMMIDPG